MIHLEFDSQSENEGIARMVTAGYMMKFDPTLEEMADVKTAVSEAVTNCVVHGYEKETGLIQMDIYEEDGNVVIKVIDFGVGIEDVEKAMEPMYTTKPTQERTGMGFSFMEAFMDEVLVESKPGEGTTVTMKKKVAVK
ncbi:MAG: anti-sigma F factor [Anaerostipes sp.]|jgi:stage II sporulation protein AB (anti-sigma F factor)|nr:anti-sigma F factor [Anaerostipes sp.]